MQQLFASPYMRVNTTTDVTGVEICGALKNVLALAAGIVEGLDLGHNAMAALVSQARCHARPAAKQGVGCRVLYTGRACGRAQYCERLHLSATAP